MNTAAKHPSDSTLMVSAQRAAEALRFGRQARGVACTVAIGVTMATLLLHIKISSDFGEHRLFILYVFPIVISATVGGLVPGLIATGVAAIGLEYLILPPYGLTKIVLVDDGIQWAMLIATGMAVSILCEHLHRARERETRQRRLFEAAQTELIEAELRFQEMFEQAAVGVAQVALDGHWLRINQTLCEMLGYSHEELVTRTFQAITHPDDLEADLAFVGQLLAGDIPNYSLEKRYIRKAGDIIWVNLTVSLNRTIDGKPNYFISVVQDIHARKESEDRSRLWACTFEKSNIGLAITDPRTNTFLAVNSTFARERGYDISELAGQPILNVFPKDRIEQFKQFADEVDRSAHSTFETEHLTKDGQRFPVLIDVTVLKSDAGVPRMRAVCVLNMTERKAAEAALRESNERLRLFIDHAPVALAMFDRNMHYLAASRRWYSDYGLVDQTIIQRSHYEIFPTLPTPWKEVHRRGLAGEVIRSEEDRFERQNGQVQWLRWEVRPWYKNDNSVGGIVILTEDITEKKAIAQALAESELQHRILLNSLADGVFVAQDERFVFANPALPKLLDYRLGEFVGLPFNGVIAPEFLTLWCERYKQRIGTGPEPMQHHEVRMLTKNRDKAIWVELRASRILYKGTPAVLGIVRDVTVQRQAAEAIRSINMQLERRVGERTAELSAANQELEAFAYAVSHDLRAPLRAMSGFSQALMEDYGERLDGTARGYLGHISQASQRMGNLIDGLLALSRSIRGELRRDDVDLSSLARRILMELMEAEPDRRLHWEVAADLRAQGDPRMLDVVIRNLLENAWKYTVGTPEPSISFSSEQQSQGRFFCVADNGAGFDMDHAKKLFQPFQRLHRQDEFPGIGIGLATVQRIIRRHGGSIHAVAAPGRGARFYFSLPTDTN